MGRAAKPKYAVVSSTRLGVCSTRSVMKVLLVYSLRDILTARRPLASLGDIHIGLSYVSAYLKARGHQTRLVVLDSEASARSITMLEEAVADFNFGCIVCTAVST